VIWCLGIKVEWEVCSAALLQSAGKRMPLYVVPWRGSARTPCRDPTYPFWMLRVLSLSVLLASKGIQLLPISIV